MTKHTPPPASNPIAFKSTKVCRQAVSCMIQPALRLIAQTLVSLATVDLWTGVRVCTKGPVL